MHIIQMITGMVWGFSFVFSIYLVYNLMISAFTLKKEERRAPRAPQFRFAVLVAARNEESVIGQLVRSLKTQDYPDEMYDVFVIPNNCTDNTRAAAEEAGALIVDCGKACSSKGEVLSYAVEKVFSGDHGYDALCVFDADNVAAPDFLSEMNNALCGGARAAQGYRNSKNPYDSAVSSCYSIYYWMINRFYNRARASAGLSSIINGCGFALRVDFLHEMGGWRTETLTEDLEFTTQCVLRGEKIAWVPAAMFYDEQPLSFTQSWTQRKRWSSGMLQCLKKYWRPLLDGAVRKKLPACFDQLVFLLCPVMQMVGAASLLLGLILDMFYIKYDFFPDRQVYFQMLLSVNFSYFASILTAALTVFLERKADMRIVKGILGYWLFIMTWAPINLICFFRKTAVWDEIKHTRAIGIDQLSG